MNASDAAALRGISIIRLLEGDSAPALDIMRRAYALDPDIQYMPEALIIALCENDMRDEAMAHLEAYEGGGYIFEQDLRDYLAGTISLVEYYTE
jgi:hypothetical protein